LEVKETKQHIPLLFDMAINSCIFHFVFFKAVWGEEDTDKGKTDIMRERKQAWKWPSQRENWAITKVIRGDIWCGL